MDSIEYFFSCFIAMDRNSPPEIKRIDLTDFSVDVTVSNVSISQSGLNSLRAYFGNTPVTSEQLEGEHGLRISISRMKIPDRVYSVFSILKYIQANQKRGLYMGLQDFGPMFLSFDDLTHAQMYGASGFGKSSFFRFLLSQTLAFHSDVVNYIIDPKQIDYRAFKDHPRVGRIASNRDEWYSLLGNLIVEMGVREHIFSEAFSTPPTSLNEYREFREDLKRTDLPQFPRILLWIDEAHMLGEYQHDDLQNHLALLLKKGRAFGIHVLATTQRIADMPSTVKSQASTVMLFYMHDAMTLSGLSLEDFHKNLTAIRGRLSFYNAVQSKFYNCQTPFLTPNEALAMAYGFGSEQSHTNRGLYRLKLNDKIIQDARLPILLCRGNNLKNIAAFTKNEIEEGFRQKAHYKFLYSDVYDVTTEELAVETPAPGKKPAAAPIVADDILLEFNRILDANAPAPVKTAPASAPSPAAAQVPAAKLASPVKAASSLELGAIRLSQNTPNAKELIAEFNEHFSRSSIDFSWCTRDLTNNQGLLQIYKRFKGDINFQERPIHYSDLALDEVTQARLNKYTTEVRENTSAQRKSPLLIISGYMGMGKNTVASTLAQYLDLKLRKSKPEDLLGFDSVRAEIQKLFGKETEPKSTTASKMPAEFIYFHDLSAALTFYRHCQPHQVVVLINEWKMGPEKAYNKVSRDFMELKEPHLYIELLNETYKPDIVLTKLIGTLLKKYAFQGSLKELTLKPFTSSGIPLTPFYLDALIERAQKQALLSQKPFDWALLLDLVETYRVREEQEKTGVTVVIPRKTLADMVASADTLSDIEDVIHKAKTLDAPRLEFAQRLRRAERMVALFSGPPGTGKSMAAEIIAKETNKELWICDFGKMQNAYVGETEKILTELFYRAQTSKAVLLLDEAEAFLSHRNSSVPAYMLKWINHLLNLIENYNGILILTTNHPESMDAAFSRRIDVKARFFNPDTAQMKKLLQAMLMPDAPLSADLDFDKALAGISLSGGLIRNALERLVVKLDRFQLAEITTDLLHAVLLETQAENNQIIEQEKRIGLV